MLHIIGHKKLMKMVAVKIKGSEEYANGYDVMMAKENC